MARCANGRQQCRQNRHQSGAARPHEMLRRDVDRQRIAIGEDQERKRLADNLGQQRAQERPRRRRDPADQHALKHIDAHHLQRADAPTLENGNFVALPIDHHPGRQNDVVTA